VWVCVGVGFVMCGCVYVWVCVCVGFVMCGCSDNCVGILVICVLVFTLFFIVCTGFFCISSFMYIIFFVCTNVGTAASK
jgi:hypothetical protein